MKENLNDVILFIIDQTSKVARQYAQREFDLLKIKVTVEQWVLLKIIHENEGLSQSDLSEKSHRDPASITRTLDLLEKKRFILRQAIPENRRQYNLKLTKEGDYFILQNSPLIGEMRALGMKGFTKTEVQLLKSLLLRMQKNYS